MTDTTLFTIYWLSAPLVAAGLGWCAVWWVRRLDRRDRASKT